MSIVNTKALTERACYSTVVCNPPPPIEAPPASPSPPPPPGADVPKLQSRGNEAAKRDETPTHGTEDRNAVRRLSLPCPREGPREPIPRTTTEARNVLPSLLTKRAPMPSPINTNQSRGSSPPPSPRITSNDALLSPYLGRRSYRPSHLFAFPRRPVIPSSQGPGTPANYLGHTCVPQTRMTTHINTTPTSIPSMQQRHAPYECHARMHPTDAQTTRSLLKLHLQAAH
ncbi:uncharacterized protein LOC134784913 [Penaeus indicus]|uniref:uncharacterized protein LOC134784913 n=1 Tax=Penaeus indicus TaxID=29960 RepID=UPI00300C2C21